MMKSKYKIKNSKFAFAIVVMLFALHVPAEAQQPGRAPRIALVMADASGADPRVNAFRQGLRELGYVEGKTIDVEDRFGEGKEDRVNALVGDLIRLNVKIIVTDGTAVTLAAKNAT